MHRYIRALFEGLEDHEFLVFDVPEEKYGHHTALVYHRPKGCYRKVVAVFDRMHKEIANAEFLGEIRMRRPFAWEKVEELAMRYESRGVNLFRNLRNSTQDLTGENVIPVGVYLVKVSTTREHLLYDGRKASLPSGYLTFYTGGKAA